MLVRRPICRHVSFSEPLSELTLNFVLPVNIKVRDKNQPWLVVRTAMNLGVA
jgi:hypothetical protein